MIPELRKKYNSEFSEEKYENFLKDLNTSKKCPVQFRICETPLFLTNDLTDKIIEAVDRILIQLQSEEFRKRSESAVPGELHPPFESSHPSFLQIDFAICREDEIYVPKLIELQAFPTTYCFEAFLNEMYRAHFSIPYNLTCYFNEINTERYLDLLRKILIENEEPENVVLMDVEPEKQKTKIDFVLTKEMIGIETVDIADVLKKGKKLFYKNKGKEIHIKRIYNRVIYDELMKKNIEMNFKFSDELDVFWADHPSWFYKISKHSLPLLKGTFVPEAYLLNELYNYPEDLENYILKPLYSFSGYGLIFEPNKEVLNKIPDKSNYILQRKIEYAPLVETPDGFSMAEIRIILLWKDFPVAVNNLVRMSKGKMMGVDFNKNKTWVGSTVAYHK